jgi:Zn-dependent protease
MFLPFKIISPGAVMIAGSATKETVGKTSLAGPVTNIILSLLCIVFASMGFTLFNIVAFINAFLAVFNLIPFGVMDGLKVFKWNKILWAAAFTAAAVLTFFTY